MTKLRVLLTLIGDIEREPAARTKYGLLCQALGGYVDLLHIHDATLRGLPRLLNALITIHPDRRVWRERFYENVPAFRARSRRAAARLRSLRGQVDAVLQIGVLFDSMWQEPPTPSVIYTDYTATLAARKPEAGRSPFSARQRRQWIALEQQALRRAAQVRTRAAFVRRAILEDYGIAPRQVAAIGGGINFTPLPELPERAAGGAPTALFIGKELYRKGGDLLLQAFAQTRRLLPEARLLLLTGDALPEGLPSAGVELIAPTWNRDTVAALYRRADLFVLPSRLETWGDVLLEAMAFGLPCIGVAGEAMEEIVEHQRSGLIVPPGDPEALSIALSRLLGDPELCRRWGAAGRRRVEQAFTWDRVAEQLAAALQTAALGR